MIIKENFKFKTSKPIYYRLGTYGDRLQDDLNWSADGNNGNNITVKNSNSEISISVIDNKVGDFSANETFTAFPIMSNDNQKKDDKVINKGDLVKVFKKDDLFVTDDGYVVDMSKLKSTTDLVSENKNLQNAISTMKEANADKILGMSKKNFYTGLVVVAGLIIVSRLIK